MSYTAPELPRSLLVEGNIRLGKIEQAHNCEILLAVESGSRAWGFPSPDSDNDVRFFFKRPIKSYLAIDPERDVIETPMDGDWDVNGWDITKALRLMVKGNATVGEWLNSPLIYRENEKSDFSYRLRDLLAVYSDPRLSARHYYGLANTCYKGDISNRPTAEKIDALDGTGLSFKGPTLVNLKKYFYAVRAAASITWVEKYNEVPPMTLQALMSRDTLPWDVRGVVNDLMHQKATMGEKFGTGKRMKVLDDYIESKIGWVKDQGFDKLGTDPAFVDAANRLLLETLGAA
jgi:predicted nucleotidyltransferase